MNNLYSIYSAKEFDQKSLSPGEVSSVVYHDLFDYPLDFSDLVKWQIGGKVSDLRSHEVLNKGGYWCVEGKEGIVFKRILRRRISERKLEIAKRASKIISLIPFVKFIGVTGSLAMQNSTDESDIDLIIITKSKSLWTSRLLVRGILSLFRIPARKALDTDQKDRLCLNMWLDESDLIWKKDRNLYTAHEIAQIAPLVNKDKTYEKFLNKNRWVLNFWPNSVRVVRLKKQAKSEDPTFLSSFLIQFEKIAFRMQYQYMRPKMTREIATPTRALFHPQDWGKVVLSRLSS